MKHQVVKGKLIKGYGVASGGASDSPYGKGSIELQQPYFKSLGLDLSGYFKGTLNLDISPYRFEILAPDYHFEAINWYPGVVESFYFVSCRIYFKEIQHSGYIYYPDPASKPAHFQSSSILEVIAPFIAKIKQADQVIVDVDPVKLAFLKE